MDNDYSEKVKIIMGQTDYTNEKALEKLKLFNYDEILVIRNYLGLVKNTEKPLKSINQEIYRQLRNHLNVNTKEISQKK
jgi:putative cell wall-binding protein